MSSTLPLAGVVVDLGSVTNNIHEAMQGIVFLGSHEPSKQPVAIKISLLTTNTRSCRDPVDANVCAVRALRDTSGEFQVESVFAALMNEMVATRATPAAVKTLLSVPVLLQRPIWDYKEWLRRHQYRHQHRHMRDTRPLTSDRFVPLPKLVAGEQADADSQGAIMQRLVDARIAAILEREHRDRRDIIRDVSAGYDRLEEIEVKGAAAARAAGATGGADAHGIYERIQRKLAQLETDTKRNEVVVGMNVMIQERLDGTLHDLLNNVFDMQARRDISPREAARILHALVAQQVLALATFRAAFGMVHADAHQNNWMHARVNSSSKLRFRDPVAGRVVAIPTFGAVLKLIDFGQSACLIEDDRGQRRLVAGKHNAWNPDILRRQDDLLRVMEVLFDPRVRRLIFRGSCDGCPHARAFRRILSDVLEDWAYEDHRGEAGLPRPTSEFADRVRKAVRKGDRDAFNRDLLGFGRSPIFALVERAKFLCPKLTTDFLLQPSHEGGAGFVDAFVDTAERPHQAQVEYSIHRSRGHVR